MKVTYPLSLKISLWLLLNLLLLAAAGVAFYLSQFGRGWESLTTGALGERLQSVADSVIAELYVAPAAEREALLAARGQRAGVELFLFLNEGRQVSGKTVELPAEMRTHLNRGPRRRGPGEFGPPPDGDFGPPPGGRGFGPGRGGRGPPPPPGEEGDFRPSRGPLGEAGRPAGAGRFVVHTTNPAATWFGLRVPLPRDSGPPQPGTLIIRAPSVTSILRLFDVLPWFGLAAAAFGLSLVFWFPLIFGITRSLRHVTAATQQIAEGKFDTRVPARRRDEIGRLGESVNTMAARLDGFVNGQKKFLGDVAHELGSPLGRLQVATEILEMRADPALREHVSDVREEVQQMAALVGELLAFTKAGMRPRDAVLTPVLLADLFAGVLKREDPEAKVQASVDPRAQVLADPALLARSVGNLVRNALRYAGDAGPITLNARTEGERVFIVVEDDGPGVPVEAVARLGEPFYRPESARTRETGGVGLGLSIVRAGVTACGGEVHFSNRTPRGFRAEISLAAA